MITCNLFRFPDTTGALKAAKNRLEDILKMNHGGLDRHDFPEILLDLANYEDTDLIQNSLLLLDRYYSNETALFQKALKTQLLKTKKSKDLYDRIEKALPSLEKYFTMEGDDEGLKLIEELTEKCWLTEEVEGFEPHSINQDIILSFGKGAIPSCYLALQSS